MRPLGGRRRSLGKGRLYKSRHKQAGALLLPTQNFVEARRGGGEREEEGGNNPGTSSLFEKWGEGRDGGVTNFSTKALALPRLTQHSPKEVPIL